MEYQNFEQIVDAVRGKVEKCKIAVAGAADTTVIESLRLARTEGLTEPILVGDKQAIHDTLHRLDESESDWTILHSPVGSEADFAVDLVRSGAATALMKGTLDTKDLLRPLVSRDNHLRSGNTMSHLVFFDHVPGFAKLLLVTDGGMVLYPSLAEKKEIILNAVRVLRIMGYKRPKVAVLAAIEKVNPKMIESVEASQLMQMNQTGIISDCIVEGPISYDVAMSAKIAEHKGYFSENCGDFDILIAPNMTCGNILGKCMTVTCGARMGGVVIGAKAPVVLTSRGSTAEEKFFSIALASLIATGEA